MVSACILLGWVSLLKSQSRFLIRKRIFRSFTKIQRQIIMIQKIHNGGGFRKEGIVPVVTQNNFNTYISTVV